MFIRVIMDFAKILVITITDWQFLYAKNNIFDADRSVVSVRGNILSIWHWACKTEVDIYTGNTAAQNKVEWCFPKATFCMFDVKLTLTETIKTQIYCLSSQEYPQNFTVI